MSADRLGAQSIVRRLRAKVEYDGTGFYGFQFQPGRRTVQGEVERALEQVTQVKTRVVGAGRTDRGVHARGQVIGFEAHWSRGLDELHRAVNAVMAADVVILEIGSAAEDFHPRFSASSRTYQYTILNRTRRSPLARYRAWHVALELDVGRMAAASRCLLGTHDMATFGSAPQGENTVRHVFRAEWQAERPWLTFVIEANAFLNRMVRRIVGGLVQVGEGRVDVEDFQISSDGSGSKPYQKGGAGLRTMLDACGLLGAEEF